MLTLLVIVSLTALTRTYTPLTTAVTDRLKTIKFRVA